MIRLAALLFAAFCVTVPVAAQEDGRADMILVLDASGSMWGQIDGVNKIVIAREVIAGVMGDIPDDLDLGLMAYGHTREGDCSDIEMLIPPGPDTRGAIVDAVNSINPRGRTPMTDAVVAAAEALGYTDGPATVVLVSDGIETCDADPCAIAAQLEESGVGFTAHVIGFDVAEEPQALAQMQCLAETTGGDFLTADNAEELAAALTLVAAAPAPATVTIIAEVAPGGTPPTSPLVWTLLSAEGAPLLGPIEAPGFNVELPAGDYAVEVLRTNQGTTHGAMFSVAEGVSQEVVVTLPALATPVIFEARLDSVDGPLITDPVIWTVGEIDGEAANPLETELPAGSYVVDAYWTVAEQSQSVQVALLGTDPRTVVVVFETPAPTATLIAPDTAVAGETIEVAWEGPDFVNDYIAVSEPDDVRGQVNFTYTSEGSPLDLVMPPEPGTYEIRYVLDQDRVVIATRTIEVTSAEAALVAPETAVAGETIEVAWEGPDYVNDYIAVSEPDDVRGQVNFTYTREGSPLDLVMPPEPGTYEIRYVLDQDRVVIATRTIEVTSAEASLIAPDTAIAGSTIEVAWEGPDFVNDYIAVSEPDDVRGQVNFTYTREGSPLDLVMPPEPGTYEIRYVLDQDRVVIATRTIEVTSAEASLIAPDTAVAGSTIEVAWEGPDFVNDYIAVSEPDDVRGQVNFTYTREGSPLDLVMPPEPGTYELRYVLDQDRVVLERRTIEITEVEATLSVPDGLLVGDTVEIGWEGPDYVNDFISIARPDDVRGHVNLTYTREGSPLDLVMPSEPGTYEVRYVLDQDRVVIARVTVEVAPVTATVVAPATAAAGTSIEVAWEGPGYENDYISVAQPDDAGHRFEDSALTRDGSPVEIEVPDAPGTYEVRYVLGQDRRILFAQEITVTAP